MRGYTQFKCHCTLCQKPGLRTRQGEGFGLCTCGGRMMQGAHSVKDRKARAAKAEVEELERIYGR